MTETEFIVVDETWGLLVYDLYHALHDRAIWLERNGIEHTFKVEDWTVMYVFTNEKDATLFKLHFM
jgi:hypothetical protein